MHTRTSITRLVNLTLSALLVFSVLAATLPQPVLAAPMEVTCKKTYTVKEGETIRRIARNNSVSVYRLAKANDLVSPYHLTAGQKLCIPEIPEASSSIQWSAKISGGEIIVTGTGFTKQHPFYIKTRESDTSKWYKLGSTQTDRNGKLKASFDVPKDLKSKFFLNVCIKDGLTDLLICQRAHRQ